MPDELAAETLARLRSFLAEAPFDRLLAGLPENIAYATGYRSVAAELMRTHRMAVLVDESVIYLVGPTADSAAALETSVDPDQYVSYGRFHFESVDATAAPGRFVDEHPGFPEAVETAARRAGSGVIGVDSYLPDEVLRRIAALPGVKDVVDATEWMYQVRAVKLAAEIDRLAVAARLAEHGIGAALDAAAPGITEREMAAAVAGAMVAGGAVPRFVVVTVGERSALSDARPTDRKWEPGELLRFDVGCVYQGYWSDVGRTAVRGEPNRLQAHRYRAILAGEEAQLHQVRPGLGADDLFRVAVEAVEAAGLRPYRRHHCGHAIGTEVYEQPIIAPGWETDLKENMVLCLETPFYELGWGGMMVEDTVVVTAEGHRRLTTSDRSLCVIEP